MSRYGKHYRTTTLKVCGHCSKKFFPLEHTKGIYCSKVCSGAAVGKIGEYRDRGANKTYSCRWCGTDFQSYHKKNNPKFCSIKCFGASRLGTKGRGGKRDANHGELVDLFENLGCKVIDCSRVGGGFPDIIVRYGEIVRLVEIKNPKTWYGRKGLNKNQKAVALGWTGGLDVVLTDSDVKRVVDGLVDWNRKIAA